MRGEVEGGWREVMKSANLIFDQCIDIESCLSPPPSFCLSYLHFCVHSLSPCLLSFTFLFFFTTSPLPHSFFSFRILIYPHSPPFLSFPFHPLLFHITISLSSPLVLSCHPSSFSDFLSDFYLFCFVIFPTHLSYFISPSSSCVLPPLPL